MDFASNRSHRARIGRAVLRRLPLAGTLVGLGLAVWLVATNDLSAVATAFGKIGVLGLAAVVLARVVAIHRTEGAQRRQLHDDAVPTELAAVLKCIRS